MNIRPISDLRNHFSEIEQDVITEGKPVLLTKDGCGSMVLLSLSQYEALTDDIEVALDEADKFTEHSDIRYSTEGVFSRVRSRINRRR